MVKQTEQQRIKSMLQGCKRARDEVTNVVSKHKIDYLKSLLEAERALNEALVHLKDL